MTTVNVVRRWLLISGNRSADSLMPGDYRGPVNCGVLGARLGFAVHWRYVSRPLDRTESDLFSERKLDPAKN